MGPGENAGAVSLGGGLACAFKVESHNHPSAVEPFQGAATGVGGILRDVFAVGARPIAILDSLRFGEVERSARSRYLLEQAVAGIGHYGNSIGVATVGGEIYFEDAYEQNCLVNAMCLGLIDEDRLIRSAAAGVGNVVLLFGARTGRDGIGGASVLASAELGELDAAKRPTVQIGDPFEEKKLLECSLELLDRDLLVALQDLGAAGLTSSSAEMASKGEVGIDLDVRKVPLREADMEAFEIMISESQERMLCVVEPERVDEVVAVCEKWLVNATAIGEVTDDAAAAGVRRRRAGRRHAGHRAGRRVPALRPRAGRADASRCTRRRAAADRRARPRRDAARAAALRQPRLAPVGVRAVRLPRRLAHGAPPRAGRRRRARAAGRLRDRGLDRRQRPPRRLRSLPRRGRGGARVLGQPRLRRRRAARADQLPQLRQPREAAHRLAAHARGRRPRRRLPRALDPGRRRQRLALQRGRRRPDLPDPGRRARRRAAQGRALGPPRLRAGGRRRRDHLGRLVGAVADGLRAREAARPGAVRRAARRPTSASCARCTPRSARACARARCARPTTSPRAGSRSRWRSAASRAASGGWTSAPLRPDGEALLFGEGPGAFVVSGTRSRCARSAARRCRSGRSAG